MIDDEYDYDYGEAHLADDTNGEYSMVRLYIGDKSVGVNLSQNPWGSAGTTHGDSQEVCDTGFRDLIDILHELSMRPDIQEMFKNKGLVLVGYKGNSGK